MSALFNGLTYFAVGVTGRWLDSAEDTDDFTLFYD